MKRRHTLGTVEDAHLIAECGESIVAFPSRRIVAARLSEGVDVVKSAHDRSKPGERGGLPPVAMISGEPWVAWDLGMLIGKRAQTRSWVLVRLPYANTTLRLALRTGRCLAVGQPSTRTVLPRGMFESRPGAVSSAFLIDEGLGAGPGAVGSLCIAIDVAQLWSAYELQLSAKSLGISPALEMVP